MLANSSAGSAKHVEGPGVPVPPIILKRKFNLVSGLALHAALPVQCVDFRSIKRENYSFIASTKKKQAGIKQSTLLKWVRPGN